MNYANEIIGSDRRAFEILSRTETTITIRELAATLDPNWRPEIIPGGFAGHCTNNREQRYTYAQQPEAPVVKARLCQATKPGPRRRGSYYDRHGNRYVLADAPSAFYDYNF